MHDATEGGVIGGLSEMAFASGTAFSILAKNIPVSREVGAVCGAFGLDPLRSLSEGTLLITCNHSRVGELTEELLDAGIPVTKIGSVRRGEGLWSDNGSGKPSRLSVGKDGYWDAYRNAVGRELR
jgi:hydrogenase expression/formation protein HypE